MFYQNELSAPIDFQRYSCRFASICFAKDILLGECMSLNEGVYAWKECRRLGIISGDLNNDGDYDDPGEDEILNDDRLFKYLGLPLRTVNINDFDTIIDSNGIRRIAPTKLPLQDTKYWIIEAWKYKSKHFVVGYGNGIKPVRFDPWKGGSNTVRYGKVESLRVFEII